MLAVGPPTLDRNALVGSRRLVSRLFSSACESLFSSSDISEKDVGIVREDVIVMKCLTFR